MKVIFPGSFDPFTKGHASVVSRALAFCDEIIIAVGYNDAKNGMFSVEERVNMISKYYAAEPRIAVTAYKTLTVDYAASLGVTHLLRGVRTVIDFEYERNMADVNRYLAGLETILLFNEPAMAHINSTTVRELIHYGKDVTDFMPAGFEMPAPQEKNALNKYRNLINTL
jgi:pantetheine-phosphate adenylyltransferase